MILLKEKIGAMVALIDGLLMGTLIKAMNVNWAKIKVYMLNLMNVSNG